MMDMNELNSYPQKIAELERKGLALKNGSQSLKDKLEAIKNQFITEIAAAKDDKDKKLYSNAEAREIELANRLRVDEEYQVILKQLSELDTERADNDIELEKVKGEFSVARYILRQKTAAQVEQASQHFVEGLQILAGLGTIFKQYVQNPPVETDLDF